MAIIRLKGKSAQDKNIYYEFDTSTEPLGEGGMGKVYRGRQISEITGMSRDVAIKFMFDGLNLSVIDRARREASIQVVSEYLVEMMGFIETTSEGPDHSVHSHYHVVSELLSGVMLADLLNGVTSTKDGRQITFARNLYKMYHEDRASFALIIMKNIASGIMTLHDKGYIHRDIDPTNIMVTEDGKIKLIDFGIAKKLPNRNTTSGDILTTQDRSLTMSGQFIGKPQYAAPELVKGFIDEQNETTDIYAMGILLYQLLIGKLPFTGTASKVLEAQCKTKTPVKNIVGVNYLDDFRKVVAKATEKDQEKRYQTAAEFRVALDAIGAGHPPKRWLYYVGGGALGIVLLALGIIALTTPDEVTSEEISVQEELYNKSTFMEGWNHLQEKKDAWSLFLLSGIYSERITPYTDSLGVIRENLQEIVSRSREKAHNYLLEAYTLNSHDPKILLEMGNELYLGDENNAYGKRDTDSARTFFNKALEEAKKTGDIALEAKIKSLIQRRYED